MVIRRTGGKAADARAGSGAFRSSTGKGGSSTF